MQIHGDKPPLLFFAVQRRSAEFWLLFCFMKGAGFHGQTGLLQFFFCNNRFTNGAWHLYHLEVSG